MGESNNHQRPASQQGEGWRDRIKRFFYADALDSSFSENSRRILIINLFSCVGFLFTFPLGINALFQAKFLLAFILLFVSALSCYNLFYLRKTHNYAVSGSMIIYPLYILMLYLVYAGGINGTGYIWIFCIPSLSLFIQGMKRGLIEVGIFILLMVWILYGASEAVESSFHYDADVKFRMIGSFLVVLFLSSIYEYSMTRFNQELRETSDKLKVLADTDLLTGLFNRRGIQRKLEQVDNDSYYLLLADVDYFKKINDVYGHDVGDFILTEFSQLVKNCLPENSLLSRWGGEEFLIAIKNGSIRDVKAIAEKLRLAIEQHEFWHENTVIHVTSSFGVVLLNNKNPLEKALKIADKRLYQAKAEGRNRVCYTD